MSETADRAAEVFSSGFNCAQAVLAACADGAALSRDAALRVASAFGGGMGRMGETCGAVTGALMAIGLRYAKTAAGEDAQRDKSYALAREFAARFKQRNGSANCRDLLGCEITTDAGMKAAREKGLLKTVCPKVVRDAAEIVEQLLAEADRAQSVTSAVQAKYGAVAQSALSNTHKGVQAVAEAFGYTPDELSSIPAEANMGLSCGNPTAMASLRLGEVVVDLGSGGGLDVFLAAQKVGPTGKAIGIDMTPSMIERAREAAEKGIGGKPFDNVEFHLASIDRMPLPDASVDCVISNCVINLAPDKPAVFREIARILKPGGRLAASDIALKKPLPAELAQDVAAYVGCIAGAIPMDDYISQLKAAGFAHVQVIDSGKDLNAYAKVENQAACCSPPAPAVATPVSPGGSCCCSPKKETPDLHARMADLLKRHNVNDYAASVKVFAVKPGGSRQ